AFWRDTLVDAAVFREWIVNFGSRDAYSRIAHLVCEVFLKLRAVGLTKANSFEFVRDRFGDAVLHQDALSGEDHRVPAEQSEAKASSTAVRPPSALRIRLISPRCS